MTAFLFVLAAVVATTILLILTKRLQARWRQQYREGDVVLWIFRLRIRFYAGHSYTASPRPLLHRWEACGTQGVVLRFHRLDARRRRVLGVQWRATASSETQEPPA